MHAKVTAYKGKLLIELLTFVSIPNETAVSFDNPNNFGQVIMNTEKNLGVSAEALELLKRLTPGHGGLGDLDWFATSTDAGDGYAFAWVGGACMIVDPETAEASRDYQIGAHQVIPNDVPQGAKDYLDSL